MRSGERSVVVNGAQQKEYYLVQFKTIQEEYKEYYTFWYTDDIDGFLLDRNGKLKSFSTKKEAVAFAKEEGFLLLGTSEYLIASSIFRKKNLRKIDCALYLNDWNIFSDVAHSINCQFLGDNREKEIIQRVYEKLFYGCNLLVKEDEEQYIPKWSKKERSWIAKVMKDGIKILKRGADR